MERAKETKCPIILVTEDQKEDWWLTLQGRRHGPRPELGQEMWGKAQQRFYMYTLSKFLELTGKYLGQSVPAEVVEDVKEHEQKWRKFRVRRPTELEMLRSRHATLIAHIENLEQETNALELMMEDAGPYASEEMRDFGASEHERVVYFQGIINKYKRDLAVANDELVKLESHMTSLMRQGK